MSSYLKISKIIFVTMVLSFSYAGMVMSQDGATPPDQSVCTKGAEGKLPGQFVIDSESDWHQGKFYQNLAAYGQVGRVDIKLPWEETDKIKLLQKS